MIILRNKFFERLFSKGGGSSPEERFPGCAELGLRDIIKLLSMGHSCKENCSHWINEVGDGIIHTIDNTKGSASLMFLGFGREKEIKEAKAINLFNKIKPTPKSSWDYFCKLWGDIYNDKESGCYKYRHLISATPDPEIYNMMFQVSAYMNGVIPLTDNIDIWNVTPDYPPLKFTNSIFDKGKATKENIAKSMKSILANLIGLYL